MELIRKIEKREAVVSVIGLGHVGFPLAAAFASAGFRVLGIDVDRDRVRSINSGEGGVQGVSADGRDQRISDHAVRPEYDSLPADGLAIEGLSATTDFGVL